MARVENDQTQLWRKNLTRLLDIFNFVALTSVFTTLLLAFFIKNNTSLLITINAPLSFLIYFLTTIFNGSTWIFLVKIIFMVLVQVLPYNAHKLSLMLLISCILLIVGLIGFFSAGIMFFLKKRFPGTADFGFLSAENQLIIMEYLIILFINGCASFSGWLILQGIGMRALSFVIVGFLGFLGSVCCIYKLFYRWKEYHRADAMISSVASTTSAAV